ncbi:MAG: hypothetical protein GVY25_14245 [Bacteroidetes bacterium]|nr:hypothetical protein [Bacteroidota bacterium]
MRSPHTMIEPDAPRVYFSGTGPQLDPRRRKAAPHAFDGVHSMSVSARRIVPPVAVKHVIADEDVFFVSRPGPHRSFQPHPSTN